MRHLFCLRADVSEMFYWWGVTTGGDGARARTVASLSEAA